jgi:hypothetical protein
VGCPEVQGSPDHLKQGTDEHRRRPQQLATVDPARGEGHTVKG